MPPTLTQIYGSGDALDANRYVLSFPQIPGGDGGTLTIRQAAITLPQNAHAQVEVKLYGYTTSFPGANQDARNFTCSFYETVGGKICTAIENWRAVVRSENDQISAGRVNFAVNAQLDLLDTMGNIALRWIIKNVWPISIAFPPHSAESSTPAIAEVVFAHDRMELQGTTGSFETSLLPESDNIQTRPQPRLNTNTGLLE